MRLLCVWLCGLLCLWAQSPLDQAYDHLRANRYEAAIEGFLKALEEEARPVIHKELAYTYLKIGETESARDHLEKAVQLAPDDLHTALEYAFLCYETKKRAEARRIFDRVRKEAEGELRATAERAFQNVDRPLAEGIARWSKAVELEPGNFSAHRELAELAEERGDLPLAERHYAEAWRLRPEKRSLLVDLGRVRLALGKREEGLAALLAASRGPESHSAEAAQALLPADYPFVYQFRNAIALDPSNIGLRRELAYLHLAMNQREAAEEEFEQILKLAPDDLWSAAQLGFLRLARSDRENAMPLLERVLEGPDEELADRVRKMLQLPQALNRRPDIPRKQVAEEARVLAKRSLEAGYLKDAVKYLTIAHETDPLDFDVMLKLGWTHNILKEDRKALRWFSLAAKSPEPAIAQEAIRAYNNLSPEFARVRSTVWLFPMFSTRWHNVFSYSQAKTELRIGNLPVRPYFSTRFIGDVRGRITSPNQTQAVAPQYLSESSIIFALGLNTVPRHGVTLWGEAGAAVSYLGRRPDTGLVKPDYRAGLSFARGFGQLLGSSKGGLFFETNEDAVYISRFQHNLLLYSQNRAGWTLPDYGGLQLQLYWNQNLTGDRNRQYWANFMEMGPGFKLRLEPISPSMFLTANLLWGRHTINEGNPRGRHFTDLRVGIWYARTR
ncbi:MAG: tetratricopeptide repeat protein [Bryobacteraceae bacterium]|nr:tetratricopeptide repeat protein [Bryobacteraceae bacterium]